MAFPHRKRMTIDMLEGRRRGCVAWIVGTGPSAGVFPFSLLSMFSAKRLHEPDLVVGINTAWRHITLDVCLSVKNHNRTRYEEAYTTGETGNLVMSWVMRQVPVKNEVDTDLPNTYTFFAEEKKNGNWDALTARRPGELFYRGGSQTAALHLAALMGCSAAILIGNDMRSIGGDHWGHEREGPPQRENRDTFYGGYKKYTRELRSKLWQLYKMPVLTLSPFVGLDDVEEEYASLKALLGK